MDSRRLLIHLPPRLAEMARAEVESPESGFETINQLINEALSQYLEELTLAKAEPSTAASAVLSPAKDFATSDRRSFVPEGSQRFETVADGDVGDDGLLRIDELVPALSGVIQEEIESLNILETEMDEFTALGGRILPKQIEPDAMLIRDKILERTRILAVAGVPFSGPGEVKEPNKDEEALFGLHNRDYPSIWALYLLARATVDGPVLWSEFTSGIERTGRQMGRTLKLIDQLTLPGSSNKPGLKYATAFPVTSKALDPRAGQWIRTKHDRGTVRLTAYVKNTVARIQGNGRHRPFEARGPLPRWSAIAFEHIGDDFLVGVTAAGLDLLRQMQGLSLELPHSQTLANSFMGYLRGHGRGDYEGFRQVLRAIDAHDRNRDELTEANRAYFTSMLERSRRESENPNSRQGDERERGNDTYVSTMTQGYVARGREWGLVRPELSPDASGKKKIYRLTPAGQQWLADQQP